MSDLLLDLEADRQRQWRRMVLASAALHVALVVLFVVRAPSFDKPANLPPVVRLVPASALAPPKPAVKAPAPAEKPTEETPPAPKPPELAKTVIPLDNQKTPKPKRPEPKPEEKPAPKPAAKPKDVDLDEFLEELREEVPAGPAASMPTAKPVQGPSGPGVLVTPEVLAWMEKVKAHVRRRWGNDPRFRGKSLSTDVLVTLTASGEVIDFEITRPSGNPWYDDSVEHFLLKESPLPPPPKGGEWPIRFTPGDLL